jgi:hypothetical protein
MTLVEGIDRLCKIGRTVEQAQAELEQADKDGLPRDLYVEMQEFEAKGKGETRVYELNEEGHMVDRLI